MDICINPLIAFYYKLCTLGTLESDSVVSQMEPHDALHYAHIAVHDGGQFTIMNSSRTAVRKLEFIVQFSSCAVNKP